MNLYFVCAWASAFAYALSYICIKRGQLIRKVQDDGGLLTVLTFTAVSLFVAVVVDLLWDDVPYPRPQWSLALLYPVLAGILATFCGRMLLYRSIDKIGASRAVSIKNMSPIVTVMLSVLTLGESITPGDIAGIGLILLGMGLFVWDTETTRVERTILKLLRHGLALAYYSAVFHAVGHIFRKVGMLYIPSVDLAAFLDIAAALSCYLVYIGWTGTSSVYIRRQILLNPYYAAGGVFSAVAMWCFFFAAQGMKISTVSVIVGTEPIITVLLGIWLLGKTERVNPIIIFGALLVVTGAITMTHI